MKLYYSDVLSPHKACAVARYLKSPVEFVYLDLVKGEQQAPAYLVLNPNGKVPTLVDGERVPTRGAGKTGWTHRRRKRTTSNGRLETSVPGERANAQLAAVLAHMSSASMRLMSMRLVGRASRKFIASTDSVRRQGFFLPRRAWRGDRAHRQPCGARNI